MADNPSNWPAGHCPDDLPPPYSEPEPDDLAERPAFLGKPMSREQLEAAIARMQAPRLTLRQAS